MFGSGSRTILRMRLPHMLVRRGGLRVFIVFVPTTTIFTFGESLS